MQFVTCPDFEEVPKILESPYVSDPEDKTKSYAPYKKEIAMIRSGKFHPGLLEEIIGENR